MVRAPGGQTRERPCGLLYCNAGDAVDWRARIKALSDDVLAAWNTLMGIENRRHEERGEQWPETRRVRPAYERLEARVAALPDLDWSDKYLLPTSPNINQVVADSVATVESQACMLEELQAAIRAYNEQPPPSPSFKPTRSVLEQMAEGVGEKAQEVADQTQKTLLTAAIVVGAFFAFRPIVERAVMRRNPGADLTPAFAVGAAVYGLQKRRRRRLLVGASSDVKPRIVVVTPSCHWSIPDQWWARVAQPTFSRLVRMGYSRGPHQAEEIARLLLGPVNRRCPLPGQANLTADQWNGPETTLYLLQHVMEPIRVGIEQWDPEGDAEPRLALPEGVL